MTIQEYFRFEAATGGKFEGHVGRSKSDVFGRLSGDSPIDSLTKRGRLPVSWVSWNDAIAYTKWLSENTGKRYRLPSEAEWEYAARAGTKTRYSWGNNKGINLANGRAYSKGGQWKLVPVGSFPANPWGLHDMHGNVIEVVQDCWNDRYRGAPKDGSAWETGDCSTRIYRGGDALSGPGSLRGFRPLR